jgi:hypothetical protein
MRYISLAAEHVPTLLALPAPQPLLALDMIGLLQLSKTRLVAFAMFLVLLTLLPLIDPDYFWHLKTGEYIVDHAALPASDVFSYTRMGHPWVLHEWLFEVILYSFFAAFGELGVRLLSATLITAALVLTFTTARRLASAATAWPPLIIGVFVFVSSMSPRPQLLTYVCFALYLSVLLRFKYEHATRPLIALPLAMIVWVNAHAAYAVGIALVLFFTACEWLIWACRPARDPEQKRRLIRLTQVACLVALASLANPGLFERWVYPVQVLGMAVNQIIQEWTSPDFHLFIWQAYLVLVLMFFVAIAYGTRKPDLTELALPLLFVVAGCVSRRHAPLAVMTLVPFTALALARGPFMAISAFVRSLKPVRWYLAWRSAGRELGNVEYALNWLFAGVVGLCLPAYVHSKQAQTGSKPDQLLVEGAAGFIAAQGLRGNLFNEYGDGGYLIYRLFPRARVAVDGRADMYGDKFIQDYLRIYGAASDWQAKFDRLAVDLAVLPLDAPIRQLLLEKERFREVYRDKHYSVLQRATARPPQRMASRQGRQSEGDRHGIPD